MSYTILLKRNTTPGRAPTAASLSLGELALNTGDGLLYYLDGSGSYSGTVRAINADTASFAFTAVSASWAPGSAGSVQEVSGVIGRFGIFSGSTFVTGSSRLYVSSSVVQVSGGLVVSGNLFISGTQTLINGLTYTWPTVTGISGTVLTNNGAGVLAWTLVSGSSGPPNTTGSFTGSFTGAFQGTSSFAVSASWSPRPSSVLFASSSVSASWASRSINSDTSSFAFTAVSASWAPPGAGGTPVAVDDENSPVTANLTRLNFTGTGVVASLSGSTINVTVPGGASLARSIESTITPVTPVAANVTGSIILGRSFILFSVSVDTYARVRLYGSQSYQQTDLLRPIGTDPTVAEPGIIVDLVLSGSPNLYDFTLSPMVNGSNIEPILTNTIYYTVTNLSSATTAVSMSFNRLVLE